MSDLGSGKVEGPAASGPRWKIDASNCNARSRARLTRAAESPSATVGSSTYAIGRAAATNREHALPASSWNFIAALSSANADEHDASSVSATAFSRRGAPTQYLASAEKYSVFISTCDLKNASAKRLPAHSRTFAASGAALVSASTWPATADPYRWTWSLHNAAISDHSMCGCAQARRSVAVCASASASCAQASGSESRRSAEARELDESVGVSGACACSLVSSSGVGAVVSASSFFFDDDDDDENQLFFLSLCCCCCCLGCGSSASPGTTTLSASSASRRASARMPATRRSVVNVCAAEASVSRSRAHLESSVCAVASSTDASSTPTSEASQSRPLTSSKSRHVKRTAWRSVSTRVAT
mmetsp:Transcript_4406/g.17909  ORF Transcript_4406/g.17909 Transcript_4406/m.17909 type:complete len:359 (+) Transcript_4406:391-1467(+)